jgi:hypothetical protein
MMTDTADRGVLTGLDGLHTLPDEAFAGGVVETAFRNARSPHQNDVWEGLLSPGLIDRGRQRAGELPIVDPERRQGQQQTEMINRVLAQVRSVRARARLQRNTLEASMYRGPIRELAVAIARHRAERVASADTAVSPEDLALWALLDTLAVPDRPDSAPRSLSWLVENRWQ